MSVARDEFSKITSLADRLDRQAAKIQGDIRDTDIANGKRLVARFGDVVRYTPQQEWLIWDETRWVHDERSVRMQAMAKAVALTIFDEIRDAFDQKEMFRHAKSSQSRRSVESMLFMARSEAGIPANLVTFDADPWVLNLANGTLDLKSGELRAHKREDLITKLVPLAFDAAAQCPRWLQFLAEITGEDDELATYLQRVVGYCLTGVTHEQVLHFLYGLGANGKSVFSEILADLLGEYAMIASPEMIMARRSGGIPNDIARLRGIRLALMNETSQGSSFDEAKLKDLTGSDSLTGRFLRAEFFDFKPTHKLIIRGNHKPAISGTDDGIWRRLRLVPFTMQLAPEKQDRDLLPKLRAELPGILNWALQGCRDWQQSGLSPPSCIASAVADYRVESDTLGRFIEERCEVRNLAQVKSSAFLSAFQEFARLMGERVLPAKELPTEMKRRGFEWKKTKYANIYEGIELKQDFAQGDWHDR